MKCGSEENTNKKFSLQEKLSTINFPPIPPLADGYSDTIENFYNNFIVQHLFNPDSVLAIHHTLIDYVKKTDAMFAIRAFNSVSTKDQYEKLRRGWLTKTDQKYSFFYLF